MGIYPNRVTKPRNTDNLTEWVERLEYPGYARERKITATEWAEVDRTDCYCCSCSDDEYGVSVDPYCRNHGWYGERGCELHNLPGASGEDGIMPESVQSINNARNIARANNGN